MAEPAWRAYGWLDQTCAHQVYAGRPAAAAAAAVAAAAAAEAAAAAVASAAPAAVRE